MTTTATSSREAVAYPSVPLHECEGELSRQMRVGQQPGEAATLRARMSNLVIFCDRPEQADRIAADIPDIVAMHPARVLLLIGEPGTESGGLTVSVSAWCRRTGGQKIDRKSTRLNSSHRL